MKSASRRASRSGSPCARRRSVPSSPVSRITLRWAGAARFLHRGDLVEHLPAVLRPARNAPRSITMSISSAPSSTAQRTCRRASRRQRPRARSGMPWRRWRPSPSSLASAFFATAHEVRVDADRGARGIVPVALVRPARLLAQGSHLLGLSLPSSVVRSTIERARRSPSIFDCFLIDRLVKDSARCWAPTASTGRRPGMAMVMGNRSLRRSGQPPRPARKSVGKLAPLRRRMRRSVDASTA
jgi:hypothetical protein